MPGQFTRPRDEQGRFISARDFIAAGEAERPGAAEPPPRPGAVTDRDVAFIAEHGGGAPEAEPIERPAVAPSPPAEPGARSEPPGLVAAGVAEAAGTAGAGAGGAVAGAPGAFVGGAAAAFLASKAAEGLSTPSPIGTLEGPSGSQDDGLGRTMKELLAVQQETARLGLPIKDVITTKATDSRL